MALKLSKLREQIQHCIEFFHIESTDMCTYVFWIASCFMLLSEYNLGGIGTNKQVKEYFSFGIKNASYRNSYAHSDSLQSLSEKAIHLLNLYPYEEFKDTELGYAIRRAREMFDI